MPSTLAESRPHTGSAKPQPSPGGVVSNRPPWLRRLNAWRKRTPFNPYWTEVYWLRRSIERLASFARGRLLDVGVGERPHGGLFEGRVTRYIGLEYPPMVDNLSPGIWEMLERVRGTIDVWGDGLSLPFADASFDTLLCIEVLEHVQRPDQLLAEFARVLAPGGRLLITVPFAAPLHQLPMDFHRYPEPGLRSALEHNGFEVELLEPRGNFAALMGSIRAQFLWRTFAAAHRMHDGSVRASPWRAPFVLPLVAVVQTVWFWIARWTNDPSFTLGYAAVARRRAPR